MTRTHHILSRRAPIDSLQELIRWLETQDPFTKYVYTDVNDCVLCRYFRARGIPVKIISRDGYVLKSGNYKIEYNKQLDTAANVRKPFVPGRPKTVIYRETLEKARRMRAQSIRASTYPRRPDGKFAGKYSS